jgi:hypothetical protein
MRAWIAPVFIAAAVAAPARARTIAGKVRIAASDFREPTYVVTMEAEIAFIEKEVDKHAAPYPGNKAPW